MFTWLAVFLIFFWVSLALMLVGVLTRAMALTVLWSWFVQPTFGLEPLTLPMAAGLITVVYLLFSAKSHLATLREKSRDDDDDDKKKKTSLRESTQKIGILLMHELITPATAVSLGWILKQVVGS